MGLNFDKDGNVTLECPFSRMEVSLVACSEFGTTDDPELLLDHLVDVHDKRFLARALMSTELAYSELFDAVQAAGNTGARADALFGIPKDDHGYEIPA
jgi:hypothetical protein